MNFSKIRLENERNAHVTKRLNRLNTWNFFKVLYRENIWRLFGFSILMLLCVAPIFVVLMLASFRNAELLQTLPILNGYGFSTGIWQGYDSYYQTELAKNNMFMGLMTVVSSLLVTIILSGGFAVVRDSFWTGKLSTVGVFKSIGKGIKANALYALITTVVTAFSVFGLFSFYTWSVTVLPLWATIIILVVLSVIAMFLVMYLLILCSVSVTYKQSVLANLDDSWRLLWLNILPNIIHFLLALVPIALYFIFQNGMLQSLFLVIILMFGGMYFPLVWQTHMMKTFALFHPVEVKKKKHAQPQQAAVPSVQETAVSESSAEKKTKRTKGKPQKTEEAADESVEACAPSNEDDPYAIADDGDSEAEEVTAESGEPVSPIESAPDETEE